jgi:hypothetical protein
MSPGMIRTGDPHFDLADQAGSVRFRLYTDIEFLTLGSSISRATGLSSYHEIDIAIVEAQASNRPRHDQIVLGVECKSHAIFVKSIIKEVLGVRRELAFVDTAQQSTLSHSAPSNVIVDVRADPPSEYWLIFASPKGLLYRDSPRAFGIQFEHWQP